MGCARRRSKLLPRHRGAHTVPAVIAGISYEITVKWAGSHPDNPLVKVVLWPGMQMQYLTTREPDDDQIECAIAAMKLVLAREEAESAKTEDAKAEDGCCQRLMLGRCQAGVRRHGLLARNG